ISVWSREASLQPLWHFVVRKFAILVRVERKISGDGLLDAWCPIAGTLTGLATRATASSGTAGTTTRTTASSGTAGTTAARTSQLVLRQFAVVVSIERLESSRSFFKFH